MINVSDDTFASHKFMDEHSLLGGEACMWTEYVDDNEVILRLWLVITSFMSS